RLDITFAYHLDGAMCRKIPCYRSPVRPVVSALEHVRLEIIVAMIVERRVNRRFVESRCDHSTHVGLIRNARKLDDLVPGRTAVARNRDYSVTGSDVEQSLPEGCLVNRADVAVISRSLVTGDCIPWPDLSHDWQAVPIELTRHVRTKPRPRIATVGAL